MVFFKKKRPLELCWECAGGGNSTRLCRECVPEQRTNTDNTCKGLQRTDTDIVDKAVILGIIDPDGYDKENRVYSGGAMSLS